MVISQTLGYNVTWAVHQIIHLGMSSLESLAVSVKCFESLCLLYDPNCLLALKYFLHC